MDEALPIKPCSVDLIRWLFIVAVIMAVFVPQLYADQQDIEPEVGKRMVSGQVATSVNTQARQIRPMQSKADPTLGEMLDESTGIKTPHLCERSIPLAVRDKPRYLFMARKRKLYCSRLSFGLQIAIKLIHPS